MAIDPSTLDFEPAAAGETDVKVDQAWAIINQWLDPNTSARDKERLATSVGPALQIINRANKAEPNTPVIMNVGGGQVISIDPQTLRAKVVYQTPQGGQAPKTIEVDGQNYQYDAAKDRWIPAPGLPSGQTSAQKAQEELDLYIRKLEEEIRLGIKAPQQAQIEAEAAAASKLAQLREDLARETAEQEFERNRPFKEAAQKVSEDTLAEQQRANRKGEQLTAGTQAVGALKQQASQGMDILNQSFKTGTKTSPALTKLAFRPLEEARALIMQMVESGQISPSAVPTALGVQAQGRPASAPPPAGQTGGAPAPTGTLAGVRDATQYDIGKLSRL